MSILHIFQKRRLHKSLRAVSYLYARSHYKLTSKQRVVYYIALISVVFRNPYMRSLNEQKLSRVFVFFRIPRGAYFWKSSKRNLFSGSSHKTVLGRSLRLQAEKLIFEIIVLAYDWTITSHEETRLIRKVYFIIQKVDYIVIDVKLTKRISCSNMKTWDV